eukprot:7380772-Karenia_brevis.AAC.1
MRIKVTPQICALTLHLERKKGLHVFHLPVDLNFVLHRDGATDLCASDFSCFLLPISQIPFGSVVH